jgi:dipeptidase E
MIILNGGGYFPKSRVLDKYFIDTLNEHDEIGFVPNATEHSKKEYVLFFKIMMLNYCKNRIRSIDLERNWLNNIEDVKVIYIAGGNTYKLMKLIIESEFNKFIIQNSSNYCVVGNSAGAVVIGKSLLSSNDENTYGNNLKDGIGLVPYSICPHYSEDKFLRLKMLKEKENLQIVGIDEDSGIVIHDNKENVIGNIVRIN